MHSKMDVRNKLLMIFEENGINTVNEISLKDIDSLQYISILVSIEEELGIEFPDSVLTQNIMGDIDGLCELIVFLLGDRVQS